MDNSTKRLFEVVIDDLDEVLSQAVDKHEVFSKRVAKGLCVTRDKG